MHTFKWQYLADLARIKPSQQEEARVLGYKKGWGKDDIVMVSKRDSRLLGKQLTAALVGSKPAVNPS